MNYKRFFFNLIITVFLINLFLSGLSLNAQDKSNESGAKPTIRLLVRMDDMGNSYGRTLGIIKASKEGIGASTSIMPTSQFFEESVRLCKANPALAVGIHITLLGTRVRSVLSPDIVPSILTPEGFLYETLGQLNKANPKVEEMEKEIRAQVGKVRATGLRFVYLDWHRGVPEAAKEIIARICHEQQLVYGQDYERNNGAVYGFKLIPLMPESWPSQQMPDGGVSYYAAPAFTKEQQQSFYDALSDLKPGKWMLMVHPGLGEPQRASVTELLCSPKTKEIIKVKNIQLVSFYDLWNEEFGKAKSR
jgi:predicted glycoside hydrolase/deacetylase ChbG (UPF0249 family)